MPTNPIFKKLQLKPNTTLCVVDAPSTYQSVLKSAPKDLQVSTALRGQFDAVHLFATNLKGVLAKAPKLKAAVKEGGMVWISYPKGKSLDTDLNRDVLREELATLGLEAVRQIAIDDTWSALRFKVTG
jgi:hypothetical protein